MSEITRRRVAGVVFAFSVGLCALGLAFFPADPPAVRPKAPINRAAALVKAPIQEAVPEIGSFLLGNDLGVEEAGFTGNPFVYVFVDETTPLSALAATLRATGVQEELRHFTGVIVDSQADPETEASWRAELCCPKTSAPNSFRDLVSCLLVAALIC